MTVNSPLGKFAAPVAAVTAVLVVGVWVLIMAAKSLAPLFGFDAAAVEPPAELNVMAVAVVGAVLGSAVATNGVKAPIEAAHKRLDAIHAPAADNTTGTS